MNNNVFEKIALIEEKEERQRRIHELVLHPETSVPAAISTLESGEPPAQQIAVQLLRTLGYPGMVKALPILLIHMNRPDSPISHEVAELLCDEVRFWRVISALLPTIEREDDQAAILEDHLVDFLFQARHRYDGWKGKDPEEAAQEMLDQPEDLFEVALYLLQMVGSPRPWADVGVRYMHKVGYPRNAPALPFLLNLIEEPGGGEVLRMLVEMGEVVLPEFLKLLWLQGQDRLQGSGIVSGICTMLAVTLDQGYIWPCLPMLVYLLGQVNTRDGSTLDREDISIMGSIVRLLEKAKPDQITSALPALLNITRIRINKAKSERKDFYLEKDLYDIQKHIMVLLDRFDEETLKPYALLLSALKEQEPLSSDSAGSS